MILIKNNEMRIEGKGDEIISDVGYCFWAILRSMPEVLIGLKKVTIPTIIEDEKTTAAERDFLNDLMTRDQKMFLGLITIVVTADTEKELENFWANHSINLKVLKFVFVKSLNKRLPLYWLWENGIVAPGEGPRPFTRITNEQFERIIIDSETSLYV